MTTLHMETTKVAAEKTAQEITLLLAKAGVSAVQTEYKDKKVVAMSFMITVNKEDIPFRLPVQTEPLFRYFQDRRNPQGYQTEEDIREAQQRDRAQGERVAWRQIYRWIQAQLALVQVGMVELEEVFLPYWQTGMNETLYQRLAATEFQLSLPPPTEKAP